MDMNKSRRDFLRTTGKGLLGVAPFLCCLLA